jgi:hypothetical protein
MHSPLLAFGILGVCVTVVSAADDAKKDQPKSLADQIAAIKKEHQERETKFYEDLRKFRDDNKKISELNDEHHKFSRTQADKLTALIKNHGKEPAAFDGILVLVGDLRYPLDDDLVKLVLEHHSANPKMGQLCFHLQYRTTEPWAEKVLKETEAKHPDKNIRGQAVYCLGSLHRYRAQPGTGKSRKRNRPSASRRPPSSSPT